MVPVLNDDVTKAAMLTPAQGLQLLGVPTLEKEMENHGVKHCKNHASMEHTFRDHFPSVGMDLFISMAGPMD